MKTLYLFGASILALLVCIGFMSPNSSPTLSKVADTPSLVGAWELVESNGQNIADTEGMHVVFICSPSYTMFGAYNLETKEFLGAGGGSYAIDGDKLTYTIDYNTADSSSVGNDIVYDLSFANENTFEVKGEVGGNKIHQKMKRIDAAETPIAGAWRIRERMRNGEMSTMRKGPRKTIKILSGSRFQWAAMNTETKQFMGTGGGTFTFEDGKYTENIEFFSRDASRVGMSLSFDGKVEGDDWHHSGKSSKGKPIMEIWARQ